MATRPGRIIETIPVSIERPRLRGSVLAPEFLAIKERCLKLLTTTAFPHPLNRRPDRPEVA